ncbi:VOC family protein [Streptomyces candidus]|uniref:Catechol 2,3-dioxygenase-like lactoylglutathione lyase family enzyme n=1 Tax=Streptomyces candidus TaxID=67283 RepID=A0A7X0HBV6_9ACTN|nr:VOC family protein [Streptomyces candidus]MBB6433669.1 catechol 2,3-dioxygenase-like lactoylglutathione lyase family enzyme [Streptomyces candidus]GHH35034.1 glyoxalase [Streptomyces candidus]
MIARLQCTVLDCPDPQELGYFYAALTGGDVDRPDPQWATDDDWTTVHTPGGPVLAFQRAPDFRRPRWPDPDHPQQFHLDFAVPDLATAHAEVLALGAEVLDHVASGRSWNVYADPAGHPFCLVGH